MCHHRSGKRDGREDSLCYAGSCVGGHHVGHLHPHHKSDAIQGGGKNRPEDRKSGSTGITCGVAGETDYNHIPAQCRKPGTGHITQISENCWEGRYSPIWPDGKTYTRNVYAHTHEECEEKLKVLIIEMKNELAELKRQAEAEGTLPPQAPKKGKKKGRKKTKKSK